MLAQKKTTPINQEKGHTYLIILSNTNDNVYAVRLKSSFAGEGSSLACPFEGIRLAARPLWFNSDRYVQVSGGCEGSRWHKRSKTVSVQCAIQPLQLYKTFYGRLKSAEKATH